MIPKIMWDLGENLIHDDKDDLGYFSYKNRKNHRYHGVSSPDHASPFHHWQFGAFLVLSSLMLTLGNMAHDAKEIMDEENLEF